MTELDVLLLSRIQFALNISFHILFPSITIGLAWLLFFFKLRFNMTGQQVWMRIYRFWVKIFALTFALGVVSGIAMSFQFGTNWPGYMETVGNVAGPLLAYEILTAFFLEATFLGVMLFGFRRVPNWVHTLATFIVAVGTSLSAFWIIALNSWMHTPTGFEMRDGVAFALDWQTIIFNPSMPYRITHMMLASGLTAAFLIAGVSAYRILCGDTKQAPMRAMKAAIVLAAILIPVQIFVGDLHGLNTLKHQPQKVAAMEGAWKTQAGAPLLLFAIPDEAARENKFELGIPKLGSLILTHDLNGTLRGLDEFVGEHPPVAPVFYAFRIMVATGLAMLALSWCASYFIFRGKPLPSLLMKILVGFSFSGWVAILAGWYVTEIGRQPFLVQGILLTKDAVTDVLPGNVALSLSVYATLYAILLVAYLHTVFYMAKKAVRVEEFQDAPPTAANYGAAIAQATKEQATKEKANREDAP